MDRCTRANSPTARSGVAAALLGIAASQPACRAVLGIEDLLPELAAPDAGNDAGNDAGQPGECAGAVWSKGFAGKVGQYPQVFVDAEDHIVLSGTYARVDLGAGPLEAPVMDAFVAKLDPEGELEWTLPLEGEASSPMAAVAPAGNVVIASWLAGAGACPADYGYVALVGASGSLAWRTCIGPFVYPAGLTITGKQILFSGVFRGTLTIGGQTVTSAGTTYDPFLVRFDLETGQPSGLLQLGKGGATTVSNVVVTPSGDLVVCGGFSGAETLLDAQPLTTPADMDYDVFALQFSVAGKVDWLKQYGTATTELCYILRPHGEGELLAAGSMQGQTQFGSGPPLPADCEWSYFLMNMSPKGDHLSSRALDACAGPIGVGVDAAGRVVAAGSFDVSAGLGGPSRLASVGGSDGFVARYDPSLDFVCSRRFGGPSNDQATGVALDSAGNAVVVGAFYEAIDLGAGPLEVPDGAENAFFLAKFPPP